MERKPIKPKQGQESVWDYPRPPKVEPFSSHIRISHQSQTLIDTNRSFKLMETSHPPTYYLPISDFKQGVLRENEHRTFCEFKGVANYFDLIIDGNIFHNIGWTYHLPNKYYLMLKDHISLYASKLDACYVNNEKVSAQEGDFYGGWITSNIVGPFKGAPGTYGW